MYLAKNEDHGEFAMALTLEDQAIRNMNFQFIVTEESEAGFEDIYVAPCGTEIRMALEEDGTPKSLAFHPPNSPNNAYRVVDEAGATLTEDQIEILGYELLDDNPQFLFRNTGLTYNDADIEEMSFS